MRLLAAAVLSMALAQSAEAAEVEAVSRIDAVTVFPAGAEVTRIAKIKIEKGEHTLVFQDLPAAAVQSSIRVEGNSTGKLEIGSVDTRRLFVPRAESQAAESERKKIEDEIEALRDEKSTLEAQVQGAETQKSLIANLTQLPTRPPSPAGSGERGEDWPAILALIASASAEAQRAALDAHVKIREVDRRIEDLEKKLSSLAPAREERIEVKVFVASQAEVEADLVLRYQVSHASWTPLYDVRLATGSKTVAPKLDLTRRAAITQNTGESWDDVALTLSTTRPSAGASAPELGPLTVDFEPEFKPRPMAAPAGGALRSAAPQATDAAAPAPAEETMAGEQDGLGAVGRAKKAEIAERPAEVVAAPFHALYAVAGRLSVANTGEAKRVQLLEESMEPQLAVRTVPKEDAKAYLYAKLVLPKGSPLLPGSVSLFRDGTFVGTSSLPILSPGEEHELGFGVDDLVRVRHAIAEEKRGETGLISTSRTDSRNFKISIKSMHERAIALTVFDQIPASENQDIKVELLARTAPTKQNVDDKRGVLVWETKLEPDQEQIIEFGYRVSWPSGKSIVYGR
jgi:uncharacterized protein (TIGR02231 family)